MTLRQKKINNEVDRLESAGNKFFNRVREGYLKIADTNSNRFIVLNADKDIDEISKEIWELVKRKMDFTL
jgi:dTMP kinase